MPRGSWAGSTSMEMKPVGPVLALDHTQRGGRTQIAWAGYSSRRPSATTACPGPSLRQTPRLSFMRGGKERSAGAAATISTPRPGRQTRQPSSATGRSGLTDVTGIRSGYLAVRPDAADR
jgi:hypothetical protein